MPGPVSATTTVMAFASASTVTVTVPPDGVWRTALVSRLVIDLTEANRVGVHLQIGPVGADRGHGDPSLGRRGGDRGHGVLDEHPDRDRFPVQRQPAGVAEGERPEVLDEPVQRTGLIEQPNQVGVVARMDTVELGFDLAPQHRERCPQLVRHVGEEAAASLLGCLELAGHVVECPSERAHRSWSGGTDPGVVLATAEPFGAVEQFADRSSQATVGDERGDERGDDDGDDHRGWPRLFVVATIGAAGEQPEQHARR